MIKMLDNPTLDDMIDEFDEEMMRFCVWLDEDLDRLSDLCHDYDCDEDIKW